MFDVNRKSKKEILRKRKKKLKKEFLIASDVDALIFDLKRLKIIIDSIIVSSFNLLFTMALSVKLFFWKRRNVKE